MHGVMAQSKVQVNPLNGLSLTWKIVTNNYENKPQSRNELLFSTAADWKLPQKGWKIYFNFARPIVPASVTGGMQIRNLNGDLFCISPTADFNGIDAGKSATIQFSSTEWVVNRTDSPDGFYLVWDNAPNETYPINHLYAETSLRPEQFLRTPQDKVGIATPASIFVQNKTIRDIPADSLIKIFPTPVAYYEDRGSFILDGSVIVQSDPAFKHEQEYLKQTLTGLVKPVKSTGRNSCQSNCAQTKGNGYRGL